MASTTPSRRRQQEEDTGPLAPKKKAKKNTEEETIREGATEKSKLSTIQEVHRTSALNREEFNEIDRLGSYSFRKCGWTRARENGCSEGGKDYRGRWRAGRRASVTNIINYMKTDCKHKALNPDFASPTFVN